MLGVGHGLLDPLQIAADGHGDGGGQVGVAGLAVLGDGDAGHLVDGLAHHIVGDGLGLLIPLFSDGASFPHAVVVPALVLGGHRGGEIGDELAGGVKVHLGLNGVDHAVVNHAVLAHGDGHQSDVGLGQAVALGGGAGTAAHRGDEGKPGLYGLAGRGINRGGGLGRRCLGGNSRGRGSRDGHHGGGAAAGQKPEAQRQGQGDRRESFHGHGTFLQFSVGGAVGRGISGPEPLKDPGRRGCALPATHCEYYNKLTCSMQRKKSRNSALHGIKMRKKSSFIGFYQGSRNKIRQSVEGRKIFIKTNKIFGRTI